MLNILPIPALKDNYIWLVIHTASSQCLIVDPGSAEPVRHALQTQSLLPIGILLTHHHADHTAGVKDLLENYSMPVFGPTQEARAQVTHPLRDKEMLTIDLSMRPGSPSFYFQVLSIPGHTHGHIAYYGHDSLFCGDTLFTGGCGQVFEGTMEEMYTSLQRLAALPAQTRVYCGHEYTVQNLSFALAVEPKNRQLQQRMKEAQQRRAYGLPTVPSTLALEKLTNPFLRCEESSVKQAAEQYCGLKLTGPIEVFSVLREWKNKGP